MGFIKRLFGLEDDDDYENMWTPRGNDSSDQSNINGQGHGICEFCGKRLSEKGCCSNPECPPY